MVSKSKYSITNIKKFFKLAGWTYKQIFLLAPFETILLFIISVLAAASPIINSFINSRLLDQLVQIVTNRTQYNLNNILSLNQPYFQLLLLTAILSLLNFIFRRSARYLKVRFRMIHLKKQEEALNIHIAQLDISRFEDSKTSNAVMKAQENLWKIRDFVDVSIDLLIELASFLISASIILQYSIFLGFYLIIATIPTGIVTLYFIKKFYEYYDGNTEQFRKRGWLSNSLTSEYNVRQNRISLANNYLAKLYRKINLNLIKQENTFRFNEYKYSVFVNLIDTFNDIFIPILFLSNVLSGKFSLGDFNFYNSRAFDIPNRLDSIIGYVSSLFDDSVGIEYVKNVFEIKNEINSGSIILKRNIPPSIEFKNVSFKYPKTTKFALKNFNIKINPNEEIAIVGENGAGKSTMIKLLLRLYDVTEGEILLNGINIKKYNLESYYKAVGVLFQDYSLYGMLSIKENITITAPHQFSNKSMIKASKQAEADKFISELDRKYETILSKSFEGGANLSTGQEQKIALARLFYRNAQLLILDEPTASIDPVSEYNIFKRIYKFMSNKTVIIISHRFSTVRNAQKIYVLDNGNIVESGSHKELMQKNGIYADAFNKQAEGYTKTD